MYANDFHDAGGASYVQVFTFLSSILHAIAMRMRVMRFVRAGDMRSQNPFAAIEDIQGLRYLLKQIPKVVMECPVHDLGSHFLAVRILGAF